MTSHNTHLAAMDGMINQLDRLHTAPGVACQVLRLLRHDDFDTNELVACLLQDPALVSAVLRLVNSSYYGLARNIGSLSLAVTYLGTRSLRLAVLNFGLLRELIEGTAAELYQDFWKRSLTMATVASRLAEQRAGIGRDEAFSAALLADIGVLAFTQLDADSYVKNYGRLGHSPLLLETERERYGFHHGQLGARLLARWNLPDSLTSAVMCHHEPCESGEALTLVTRAASEVSDTLWTPGSANVDRVRRLLMNYFSLDLDGFISLAVDCRARIQETASMFGVIIDGTVDCDTLLAEARRQYMQEAMEVAIDWDSLAAVAHAECSP
jgi:HD-like signal output (HDOD) protein